MATMGRQRCSKFHHQCESLHNMKETDYLHYKEKIPPASDDYARSK